MNSPSQARLSRTILCSGLHLVHRTRRHRKDQRNPASRFGRSASGQSGPRHLRRAGSRIRRSGIPRLVGRRTPQFRNRRNGGHARLSRRTDQSGPVDRHPDAHDGRAHHRLDAENHPYGRSAGKKTPRAVVRGSAIERQTRLVPHRPPCTYGPLGRTADAGRSHRARQGFGTRRHRFDRPQHHLGPPALGRSSGPGIPRDQRRGSHLRTRTLEHLRSRSARMDRLPDSPQRHAPLPQGRGQSPKGRTAAGRHPPPTTSTSCTT